MRKDRQRLAKVDKICEICGNKGVGRNFGAITCESCKAFFRRNSLKNKTLKCKLSSNCLIDYRTRKVCKKCRLSKCLSVGMKKEFIKNYKQKNLTQKAIEDINQIQNANNFLLTKGSVTDGVANVPDFSADNMFAKIFENNKKVYSNVMALNRCIADNLDQPPLNTNQKHLFNQLFVPILRPIDTYQDWTDPEHQLMSDLSLASSVFENLPTDKRIVLQNIYQFYELWGNRIEIDTQNIIQFTKSLTMDTDICHNDQIALVKYSSMELIVLRANCYYNDSDKTWTCNVNNDVSFVLPMQLLKQEKRNLYDSYKCYLNKILPEWNRDLVILNLLSAIVLFNPNRPNMVRRETVKAKQEMFIYLLQRYLMIKYRWEWQSKSKMSSLMNALTDLQHVSQIEVLNGIEEYISYFGPVFREILG